MNSARRSESDVEAQPEPASSREPDDSYVGRVSPDDADAGEETGAERRAQAD